MGFELRHTVERLLYRRGFTTAATRGLLYTQLLLSCFALAAGLLTAWYSLWPLSFAFGTMISTFSLWHIIQSVRAFVPLHFSALLGLRLFVGFSGRLALVGILLFAFIVLLKAPVVPLLLGLSSTVVSIVLWGISRISRKTVKEA